MHSHPPRESAPAAQSTRSHPPVTHRLWLPFLALAAILVLSRPLGAGEQPFFHLEHADAADAWADPVAGVWFFCGPWHYEYEGRWSQERCKEEIRKGWGKGGWYMDICPILRDTNGKVWFFNRGRYDATPFAWFDGNQWGEHLLPEASRNAPPRRKNRGGPRYLNTALLSSHGTPIFFEDLGAFAARDQGFLYASFYDFSTYDYGPEKDRKWPPPIYLRVEPRWTAMPDGSLLVWGDPREPRHLPDGVMRLLCWDGRMWHSMPDFRGIPAQRLRDLVFLSDGSAWAFVRTEKDTWRTAPVFLPPGKPAPTEAAFSLHNEDEQEVEFEEPAARLCAWRLFAVEDKVFVVLDRKVYALLSNGLCRRITGEPWDGIDPSWPPKVCDGPDVGKWILTNSAPKPCGLYLWDGARLRVIQTGLGTGIRELCGVGPDGRLYLEVGRGETHVVSILPEGVPTPTLLPHERPPGPMFGPHPFNDQGRVTAHWGPEEYDESHRWASRRLKHHPLGVPCPPTHVFEGGAWKRLWTPQKPPPLVWLKRSAPPPQNLLEQVPWSAREDKGPRDFIARHYDQILGLLNKPDAPYYRHCLGLIQPAWVLLLGQEPAVFNGRRWYGLAALYGLADTDITRDRLFRRGAHQLWWYETTKQYRCLEFPADMNAAPRLKHVISIINYRACLGLEGRRTVWDLGVGGPRKLAEIDAALLKAPGRQASIQHVDRLGRVYKVHKYKGLLSITDGKREWTLVHRAFCSPNHPPHFALGPRGRIWCATLMGLIVLDAPRDGGGGLEVLLREPRGSEFDYDRITFDSDGNLWVAGFYGWRVVRNAADIQLPPR